MWEKKAGKKKQRDKMHQTEDGQADGERTIAKREGRRRQVKPNKKNGWKKNKTIDYTIVSI